MKKRTYLFRKNHVVQSWLNLLLSIVRLTRVYENHRMNKKEQLLSRQLLGKSDLIASSD